MMIAGHVRILFDLVRAILVYHRSEGIEGALRSTGILVDILIFLHAVLGSVIEICRQIALNSKVSLLVICHSWSRAELHDF